MVVSPGATPTSIVLTLASASLASVAAATQYAQLCLRVNGVLCAPISIPFVA
jgi:hypothetical protein